MPRSVADAVAKKAQPERTAERNGAASQKQERRKQRMEGEKRRALRHAYTTALGNVTTIDAKIVAAMAAALSTTIGGDDWRVICAARRIEKPKDMTWEQERRFKKKFVPGLAKGQLAGFVLQCLALMADPFRVDVSTRAMAAAAGINSRKIEEAVSDAMKEQFAPKKPQAKADANTVRSRHAEVSAR